MIGVILSIFDNLVGPKTFFKIPNSNGPVYLDHVPLLMDLFKEGFFVHEFGDLKTANLIFEIHSPIARGRKELLMFSIISYKNDYNFNLNSFQEVMEFFVYKLKTIDNLYKGFHGKEFQDANSICNEISHLLYSFYDTLPNDNAIIKQNFSIIPSYELSPSGRDSIMTYLQEKFTQSRDASNSLGL